MTDSGIVALILFHRILNHSPGTGNPYRHNGDEKTDSRDKSNKEEIRGYAVTCTKRE